MEESLAYQWLHNKWLCWGVGPFLAANIGFFLPVIIFESYLTRKEHDASLIDYGAGKKRRDFIEKTREKASFDLQLRYCLWTMLGPTAIVNALLNAVISDVIFPVNESTPIAPSLLQAVVQLIALLYIGDLGLYWGHRIQHMSEFLWVKCHSLHHTIDTPTPVSTLYIDAFDATLQGGIPILLAAWLVHPHPFVLYVYVALRLADNALNHSGIDLKNIHSDTSKSSWMRRNLLLDILSCRFLPFRSSIQHHDAHHKYSNYGRNAKNYGEFFWLWDFLFGTLSKTSSISQSATIKSNNNKNKNN